MGEREDKAVLDTAQKFHEKAVDAAKALVALEAARSTERQDPDGVYPAAQAWRNAEREVHEAADALVAMHVQALRS